MASKTVALDTEAHDLRKGQNRPNESFGDAVKRLALPRRPLSSFAGMWGDLSARARRALDQAYWAIRDADRRRSEKIRPMWGKMKFPDSTFCIDLPNRVPGARSKAKELASLGERVAIPAPAPTRFLVAAFAQAGRRLAPTLDVVAGLGAST